MTREDMARKLIAMGKKGYCPNHQDNALLIDAGTALLQAAETEAELRRKLTETGDALDRQRAERQQKAEAIDKAIDLLESVWECPDPEEAEDE